MDFYSEIGKSQDPRPVSRGSKIQVGFIGLDSLYLVVEYPKRDVFEKWAFQLSDLNDVRLNEGIASGDLILRHGAHGNKLSIWDGDARLYYEIGSLRLGKKVGLLGLEPRTDRL